MNRWLALLICTTVLGTTGEIDYSHYDSKIMEYVSNKETPPSSRAQRKDDRYMVNFTDVPVIQVIRFLSQIGKMNFVFNSHELDFNVTIISEEATSVEDLMTALLQVLKIHNLNIVEQGNTILIYNISKEGNLSKLSTVVTNTNASEYGEYAVITRVFALESLSVNEAAQIIKPLLSKDAIVEVSTSTKHLIVTDLTAHVRSVQNLIESIESTENIIMQEYHTRVVDPHILAEMAKNITSSYIRDAHVELIPQIASGFIYVIGAPMVVRKVMHVLESLDNKSLLLDKELHQELEGTLYEIYPLQHLGASKMIVAMKEFARSFAGEGTETQSIIKTLSNAYPLPGEDGVMLWGSKNVLDKVKPMLSHLDQGVKQVYLEMLVIDVSLINSLNFGVEWAALGDEQEKIAYGSALQGAPSGSENPTTSSALLTGARQASATPPPSAARTGTPASLWSDIPLSAGSTGQFGLGIIGNILRHNGRSLLTLGALVSALETDADVSIVLHPRLMVENGEKADLFVGQNVPYQTKTITSSENSTLSSDIDYEDVGNKITVRPVVGPNNIVTLEIEEEISEVVASSAIIQLSPTNSVLAPTTSKVSTKTRVHVPDGYYLVMSGHVKDKVTYNNQGIPCLGSLPWIGSLFSQTSDTREKRNLIMFIRPHVITDTADVLCISNQEGYHFNYEARPESLHDVSRDLAPESQVLDDCIPPSP